MSEVGHLVSVQTIKRIPNFNPPKTRSQQLQFQSFKTISASRRSAHTLVTRKRSKTPRRLITISTADGRWNGNWTCDYLLSLRDLRLEDLVEDEQKDAEVSVNLCIQKHASFGFSIEGRVVTSFTRKCSSCSSPYRRKIDTNFNVWVLQSSRSNPDIHLPEIGGDDPSVIYVKPGYEAHLDALVQDTIRLTAAVRDTCSESCEKSEPTLQYVGRQNAASVDKRWSRLLELKKTN